jgi:cysteine desulfurase
MDNRPIYLDCNATTPIEPSVCDKVSHFLEEEMGNSASRTHVWGMRAKQAVQVARHQVADVVKAKNDEVIFTSGATESNNIALLGLARYGEKTAKKHIVTTKIEHKSVLEPLAYLREHDFEISYVPVDKKGWIDPKDLADTIRDETLAVSIMHVNNETGVIQPISQITEILGDHPAFLHVDAAQGFGKEIEPLRNSRIDMISISAHKIFGPKGIGALVVRRRGFKRLPLEPIMFGGGHERGLRPGTLPVQLIVGFGEAAELALSSFSKRESRCRMIREKAVRALTSIGGVINGDDEKIMPHVLNISFPGLDSEAALVALKDVVAISNGSACTSQSYAPSHVLEGMGLDKDHLKSALRISWCHMTPDVDWKAVASRLRSCM